MRTSMWRRVIGGAGLVGLLGVAAPALAQPAQDSSDCRIPGGCGTSSKPGGVERAPGGAMEERSVQPETGARVRAAKKKAKPDSKAQRKPQDGKSGM